MELVPFTMLFLFLGAPMLGAGYWLATKPEYHQLRVVGISIFLVGLAPLALWMIFLVWWLFYAEG